MEFLYAIITDWC